MADPRAASSATACAGGERRGRSPSAPRGGDVKVRTLCVGGSRETATCGQKRGPALQRGRVERRCAIGLPDTRLRERVPRGGASPRLLLLLLFGRAAGSAPWRAQSASGACRSSIEP